MIKKLLMILALLVFAGCGRPPYTPKFEDTNAYLVKQSIEKISLADSIAQFVGEDDAVALVSIENAESHDLAVSAMIEDVFLKQLVDRGYQVVERDFDLLFRLLADCDSSYRHVTQGKRRAFSSDLGVGVGNVGTFPYSALLLGRGVSGEVEHFDDRALETNLRSADKLIAYRVLECGIVYEVDDGSTRPDSLTRVADTILMVRAEDAKSGEILKLFPARGTIRDRIKASEKPLREYYQFHHYRFGFPSVYGNPAQLTTYTQPKGSHSATNVRNAAIGVGVTLAAVALAFAAQQN